MKQLDQFRALLADLRRHESALKTQALEYAALEREIDRLRERAAIDPDARKKLQRLDDVMKSGGAQLQERIAEKAAKLATVCDQLGEQLKGVSSGDERLGGNTRSQKPAAPKRVARTFV
ncbi:MAG TPA: hypothetical protein VL598_11740 [Trinickia sp.]|jgi:hypothetical protein|uniref:hypothetical protein n=1 Tax=Trinickia sp. TaxID=2571163 RepID=UPI002D111454|nr:hypothetical protein [Trinickia sp.]HTI18328.1 hypothetical protein [Trinickia sp.]